MSGQKPVCLACERYYQPEKNGFWYVEGMPDYGVRRAQPGKEHADQWRPYKVWMGDKWRCPGCGHEIIIGALNPVSEHYQPDFAGVIERLKTAGHAFPQINDC